LRNYKRKRPSHDKDKRMSAVARMRADGKSLREIARELGVSSTTVMNDIKRSLGELPGQAAGDGGYVYVLRYDDGLVKVGRTRDARSRLTGHATTGRVFGRQLAEWWVSPPHDGWRENEKTLVSFAADLGAPVAAEYFPGISFDDLVARAKTLSFRAPDPAAAKAASRQEPPELDRFIKSAQAQIRWGGLTEDEAAEQLAEWITGAAPGFARVLIERCVRDMLTAPAEDLPASLF
jgi:hypothetical protein